MPFRCREVAPEQPGVPEVLLDQRPQREIVPRLAPSSLEHGPGPPPPFGLGDAHPQVQQHAGPSRPGHREVHCLLQDAPRQRGVPALVVRHARLVGPTHQVLASVVRRGSAGHLPELGRGLRRSAGGGQQGGLLEGGGDGDVRALDGQSQVAGSFLRIADDRREPRVQLATPGRWDLLIDGGREEGVREPEAVADDLDDAVLDAPDPGERRTAEGAIAAATASSVGADRAETTSSASTVSAGSPSRRSSMSSWRRSGSEAVRRPPPHLHGEGAPVRSPVRRRDCLPTSRGD